MSSPKNNHQTVGSKLSEVADHTNNTRESRFASGLYDYLVSAMTKAAYRGEYQIPVERAKFGNFEASFFNRTFPEEVVRRLRHEDICVKYEKRSELFDMDHDPVEVSVPHCYLCPGERQRMTQHP